MKKFRLLCVITALTVCILTAYLCFGCAPKEYVLTEKTFFKVMTNIQYFPEQYLDKNIEFDAFTYSLTDAESGEKYICVVRKCSSGYGCNCGNDTVIGFILSYDGDIPEPKNQSEDTNDKAWVHVKGKLSGTDKTDVKVYAYENGVPTTRKETIQFLSYSAQSVDLIEDYSGLNYYVTK